MNSAIEKLDVEIERLTAEVRIVEAAPPTVAERHAAAAAELRSAEQLYRTRGLRPAAPHPAEQEHLQRLAVVGMCMVIDAEKILKTEHQRIAAEGEGLSAADKARKLDELRRAILRTAAKRELATRATEGDGFLPRVVHPELAIYKRTAVERLAG